ncbi:hypothetical protein [Burkholderia gladioli]|uniref:hypothetical protein n=1 Tax=Burkholderia gladioli TaxID=28095 RepID=UPI000BF0F64D|nr:hypothetical protein [Burkholderia gladioli]PEH83760.1 hypothetical protein CRM95_01540 [Burkholderia gladioli]
MDYPATFDSTQTTLTIRDLKIEVMNNSPDKHTIDLAREKVLEAIQQLISQRVKVPGPSDPDAQDILVSIPASAALAVLLSNTMIEKGVTAAKLSGLLNLSRQEAHRMLNIYHQTKIDRVHDALAAMGTRLKFELERIRQIPVYKTADGTPTFRRYQLLDDGSAIKNRNVGQVRAYTDELLMLVQNQGTGAQELMLVGPNGHRTAAECSYEQA